MLRRFARQCLLNSQCLIVQETLALIVQRPVAQFK